MTSNNSSGDKTTENVSCMVPVPLREQPAVIQACCTLTKQPADPQHEGLLMLNFGQKQIF